MKISKLTIKKVVCIAVMVILALMVSFQMKSSPTQALGPDLGIDCNPTLKRFMTNEITECARGVFDKAPDIIFDNMPK